MAFRSSASATGTGTGTITATPAGVQAHDYLGAWWLVDGSALPVLTPPVGWTQRASVQTSLDGQTQFYADKADASGSDAFGFADNAVNDKALITAAWSGRNNSAPRSATPVTTGNSASNTSPISATITGITAVNGDDIGIGLGTDDAAAGQRWTYSTITNYTEQVDGVAQDWVSGAGLQTRDNVSAGATGNFSVTITRGAGAGNSGYSGIVVAIAAAAAATSSDAPRTHPLLMTLGQRGLTAKPWALQSYQPATVTVPPVPPTLSPILARFEQRFGRQPMGRVVPKESSPRNSFTFGVEVGSYALTGQSASLLATRLLNATAGSYVLTGKAAGLLAARLLNGTAGSYTITGRAALLAAARLLNVGAGAYTYTGRNGALLRGALMPAVAGAYAINGADADLQQAGAGAFVFGAAPGVYSITGFDASLILTTVTPTPTPSQSPASLGGGYGIQDRYWREREKLYDRTKRKAKKRSKRAVEIVEELARRELDLSEAIVELHEELAAANLKSAEIYVDLLRMKLELVEEDDDDDDLLLLH